MNEYYPIGTVVKLRLDDSLLIMIAGYLPKQKDSRPFDYFGVPFPFGMLDESKYICFDRNAIVEVVHKGYCDAECKKVLEGLSKFTDNLQTTAMRLVQEVQNKQAKINAGDGTNGKSED